MRRGTTPDYILTIPGYDLRESAVYVTIRQDERKLTLSGERLDVSYGGDDTSVAFRLTQQETLDLRPGKAQVQVRWADADGTALCTEIGVVSVAPVLLEEVIAHGEQGNAAG